jgi:hypothetical protein
MPRRSSTSTPRNKDGPTNPALKDGARAPAILVIADHVPAARYKIGITAGGSVNQVMHGWIGDVRVVSRAPRIGDFRVINRALPVDEFMIAR